MAFSVVDEDFFSILMKWGEHDVLFAYFFKFLFLEPLWGSKNKNSPRCARRCEKIFLRKIFFLLAALEDKRASAFVFYFSFKNFILKFLKEK